jgi:hypothetical protein
MTGVPVGRRRKPIEQRLERSVDDRLVATISVLQQATLNELAHDCFAVTITQHDFPFLRYSPGRDPGALPTLQTVTSAPSFIRRWNAHLPVS